MENANINLQATVLGADDPLEVTIEAHTPSSRPVEEVAQLCLHQRWGVPLAHRASGSAIRRVTRARGERDTPLRDRGLDAVLLERGGRGARPRRVYLRCMGGASAAALLAEFTVQHGEGEPLRRSDR